jgi:hypothetical protein
MFQLLITVEDIDPPIWRRLLVPDSIRLSKLHLMIQAALGWWNYHLHARLDGLQNAPRTRSVTTFVSRILARSSLVRGERRRTATPFRGGGRHRDANWGKSAQITGSGAGGGAPRLTGQGAIMRSEPQAGTER